ncbi:XRE family transcriptional regulator, partial [Streptomyces sp. SID11233]|nr:XRE family transcriptional regulator [Streptomyces sp. SID11233]
RSMETTQSAVSEFERLGGDPRLSTIMRYARAVGMKVSLMPHTESQSAPDSPAWEPLAHSEEPVPVVGHRRGVA